jgi:hypothetical protein
LENVQIHFRQFVQVGDRDAVALGKRLAGVLLGEQLEDILK